MLQLVLVLSTADVREEGEVPPHRWDVLPLRKLLARTPDPLYSAERGQSLPGPYTMDTCNPIFITGSPAARPEASSQDLYARSIAFEAEERLRSCAARRLCPPNVR